MTKQIFSNGHALVIGAGADLPCTVDDAKGLATILKDDERCAYPPTQVCLLNNEKAGRDAILAAMDSMAGTTEQDSTVVIYFSGHGAFRDDTYFLLPHGYNIYALSETAISGNEFAKRIAVIPAARKLILLDCCHAGGVGDAKSRPLVKSPLPPEAIELFGQGNGYVVIASSREDELSYTGKPYSVFTGALIEALCGKGVAKKDGYVRVADLAMYTRERIPQLTDDKQHPILHFRQADNFVLAWYAGGAMDPKTPPVVFKSEANLERGPAEAVMAIEELFVNARYDQAYEQFHLLCGQYSNYESKAAIILTRFRDLQDQMIAGILPIQQQNTVKFEIAHSFQTCLKRFKEEYLLNDVS